jgi:hypothetical protein
MAQRQICVAGANPPTVDRALLAKNTEAGFMPTRKLKIIQ